jgi:inositol oxygenase
MIRYHSFYAWHREGAYRHLMNADDEAQLRAVQAFNRGSSPPGLRARLADVSCAAYDLYSKSDDPPDVDALKGYYQELISEYFDDIVEW